MILVDEPKLNTAQHNGNMTMVMLYVCKFVPEFPAGICQQTEAASRRCETQSPIFLGGLVPENRQWRTYKIDTFLLLTPRPSWVSWHPDDLEKR